MNKSVYETRLDHFRTCETVREETTYLEICVSTSPTNGGERDAVSREGTLDDDVFIDWLEEKNQFRSLRSQSRFDNPASLRLVIQKNVRHPNTFKPNVLSLTVDNYQRMMSMLELPLYGAETSSVVGPLFWRDHWRKRRQSRLLVIYRKADVINPESPSGGFELLLSNDFEQRITTAFYKGSRSSGIDEILNHLRASARDIWHPVLLPLLILQSNIGPRQELHQREARALLQQVERDISAHMRPDVVNDGQERRLKPLPLTNADLIDCHSKVWKNPNASLEIVDQVRLQSIIKSIWDYSRLDIFGKFYNSKDLVDNDNREFESRIKFIRQRLSGLESYSHTTLSRIDMQRNALHNILLDRQNQTSLTIEKLTSRHNILLDRQNETALDIERRQQTEAHQKFVVNQSWSRSQLSLSLLGTIFLPGAFIAAIFSTTFFNFQAGPGDRIVSPHFWIFWALALPSTAISLALLGLYRWAGESRDKRFKDIPLTSL